LLGLPAMLALAAVGCGARGDALPREPISGTVTLDGAPLKSGSILFEPTAQGAVSSGGMIADGSFRVSRNDGPIPGTYRVMIFAAGAARAPAQPDVVPGQETKSAASSRLGVGLIPIRYNLKTELTAEVKSGGPNTYTFDLKSR